MPLFGTDGLINHVSLLIGAAFILGSLMFRKNVANGLMDFSFSPIGSSACGILTFIVMDNMFNSLKWNLLISLIVLLVTGFLLAPIIGDGEAE